MVHRGRSLWGPRCPIWVSFLIGAFFALTAGFAHAEDTFAVTGVPVDVTADTAAAAREQALLDGQHKAADILLRRLTLQQDWGSLPVLADAQLFEVVEGIEVEREKISTVRYLGDLTVRFKPNAIRALLRNANIRYAETVSKPLVVLPVYRNGDSLQLWDDSNPWLSAWGAHVTKGGLVPLVVPLGDLTDIATISADEAVQGNSQKLAALAQRYQAADALVVVAAPVSGQNGVDVSATRYGVAQQDRTDVIHVPGQGDDTGDALLARAVQQVEFQVEENWKQENILHFDREEMLSVTVPLKELADWVTVHRKLGDIAAIRSVELQSLSKSEALVGLHYIGDIDQLKLALAQKDLELDQDAATWTLHLAVPAVAPPAAAPVETAPGATVPGTEPPAGPNAPSPSGAPDVSAVPDPSGPSPTDSAPNSNAASPSPSAPESPSSPVPPPSGGT